MNEYLDMWRNFANFSGRTSRRGYWMAFLMNVIVSYALGFLATAIGLAVISTVYSVAVMIPITSLLVRRLRDAGCHWTNILWSLLPVIGIIILIVKLCKPSAYTRTV